MSRLTNNCIDFNRTIEISSGPRSTSSIGKSVESSTYIQHTQSGACMKRIYTIRFEHCMVNEWFQKIHIECGMEMEFAKDKFQLNAVPNYVLERERR